MSTPVLRTFFPGSFSPLRVVSHPESLPPITLPYPYLLWCRVGLSTCKLGSDEPGASSIPRDFHGFRIFFPRNETQPLLEKDQISAQGHVPGFREIGTEILFLKM